MIRLTERSKSVKEQIKRLEAFRKWIIPVLLALVGLILRLFLDFSAVEAFINAIEGLLLIFSGLSDWLKTQPLFDLISTPAVFFLLGIGLEKFEFIRNLMEQLFPDPPDFVFMDLALEKEITMTALERNSISFFGREAELRIVDELLSIDCDHKFLWKMVTGPSGIGKTRLAIEWLSHAQSRSWDFGVVNPAQSRNVGNWSPRKPSAFVIDEARLHWGGDLAFLLSALREKATKKTPIRVLVVSQLPPFAFGAAPEILKSTLVEPELTIPPLDYEDLLVMAHELGGEERKEFIAQASWGRPRAALILANYSDARSLQEALDEWTYRLLPDLRAIDKPPSDSLLAIVLCSALAGPIERDGFTSYFPEIKLSEGALFLYSGSESGKFFGEEQEIPRILPEDIAQNLVRHLLWRTSSLLRSRITEFVLRTKPSQVEALLHSVWTRIYEQSDPSLFSDEAVIRMQELQTAFDEVAPISEQREVPSLTERLQTVKFDTATGVLRGEQILEINNKLKLRPFDDRIFVLLSETASNVFHSIKQYPQLLDPTKEALLHYETLLSWMVWHHKFHDLEVNKHVDDAEFIMSHMRAVQRSQNREVGAMHDSVSQLMQLLGRSQVETVLSHCARISGILRAADRVAELERDNVLFELVVSAANMFEHLLNRYRQSGASMGTEVIEESLADILLIYARSGMYDARLNSSIEAAFELSDEIADKFRVYKLDRFEGARLSLLVSQFSLMAGCIKCDLFERYFDLKNNIDNWMADESITRRSPNVDLTFIAWVRSIIHFCGERGRFLEIDGWADLIDETGSRYENSDCVEIRRQIAFICLCCINHSKDFISAGSDFTKAWLDRFAQFEPEFVDDQEFITQVAKVFEGEHDPRIAEALQLAPVRSK